jgi:hypothetical protein
VPSSKKLSFGKLKAREIVRHLRIESPDELDIEDISWHCGALVKETSIRGADGRVIRTGTRGVISVRQDINEPGKKRFVAAHELGHFEIHAKRDQLSLCLQSDFLNWYHAAQPDENEANEFAAELLLPEELFAPRAVTIRPIFEGIEELAREFRTTLTATTIRFVECTPERCAFVVSEDRRIKWFRASDDFGYFLMPGTRLHENSYAADFFQGKRIEQGLHTVRADAWLQGAKLQRDSQIKDTSRELSRYGQVISLLWIDHDIDDSDPDEEEPQYDPDHFNPDGKRWRW